jgi:hypothetical protein
VKGYSYVQQGEHEIGATARVDADKKAKEIKETIDKRIKKPRKK